MCVCRGFWMRGGLTTHITEHDVDGRIQSTYEQQGQIRMRVSAIYASFQPDRASWHLITSKWMHPTTQNPHAIPRVRFMSYLEWDMVHG
jgi:hypothetical protein